MNKRIITIGAFLCLLCWSVMSQVAMGKWRTHFAYNSVTQIAQSENKIYAVSDGALFSVDKEDANMEFYSKVSGLNGSNISCIEYDPTSKQLLIIYANGNIDLLTNGGVINIPDLYNKQISASKEVNHICFYQDYAYLSCDFGIIALNMKKREIADTYYIGANASEVKVLGTTVLNGQIYALTSTAIYTASASESHLVDYEFWSTVSNLPGGGEFQAIASFAGKLFIQRNGKLYVQNGADWAGFLPEINVSYFNVSNGKMLVNDGSNALYIVNETLNYTSIQSIGAIPDAEFDSGNNIFWLAANTSGIVSYKPTDTGTPELSYYKPAGPAVNSPWDMTFAGKKLFVVPGGRWSVQDNKPGNVMMYENNVWTNIYSKEIVDSTEHDALDFVNVAVDPDDDKHFFATSFGTGLYEFKNNAFFKWYNCDTPGSTLETIVPAAKYNYIRLDGAIFDANKNLLLANMRISKSAEIKYLTPKGEWGKLSYPFPYMSKDQIPTLGKIVISSQNPNQKWIPSVRYAPGICVFDDNGTLTNQSDDKSVFIETFVYPESDNTGKTVFETVSPNYVYTLAQDKNGVIWVGTEQGPFLFQNLTKVFDSGYTCSRVKIPRNDSTGLADYLLANERIRAIAIDGANRKWLGTESSGVYLMSENGQETIKHFTVSNSPLLSNNIMSIAINPVTGEVFFGTSLGLVSFQSDAAEAGTNFENAYAYPNPVREGFSGIITITGLVENSQVKITDINGNLICQTVSNGSIATWDGKDTHGRKVSTGVYLAMCSNEDGSKSTIVKILVIN